MLLIINLFALSCFCLTLFLLTANHYLHWYLVVSFRLTFHLQLRTCCSWLRHNYILMVTLIPYRTRWTNARRSCPSIRGWARTLILQRRQSFRKCYFAVANLHLINIPFLKHRMLLKCFRFNNTLEGYGRQEYDDNDSRYSFSSSSSPPLQGMMGCSDNGQEMLNLSSSAEMNNHNNSSDMHCDKLEDSKDMLPLSPDSQHTTSLGGVQIIAASGAHIIAVANPALALSPALSEAHVLNVKREVVSPDVS